MNHISFLFSLILLCLATAASAQAPDIVSDKNNTQLLHLDRYVLHLPLVDFNGIPGLYQDATIEYAPQTQSWRLMDYSKGIPLKWIDEVRVVVTTELPVQVFLDVSGTLNNGCAQLGDVGINQADDLFVVYLYYRNMPPNCQGTENVRPFRKIIPLDVYGLPAGTYSYSFNGRFGGSFTLAAANVLP